MGPDWYEVEISAETVSKTNLGGWRKASRVNLERALRVGDELGGHIVSGHVDGVAEVIVRGGLGRQHASDPARPRGVGPVHRAQGLGGAERHLADGQRGDGVRVRVNLIPHTRAVTTWGTVAVGDAVNLEIDTLARYVARLAEAG